MPGSTGTVKSDTATTTKKKWDKKPVVNGTQEGNADTPLKLLRRLEREWADILTG